MTFEKAKNNDWSVVLTPTKPVPKEWFCEMKGAKVLGLASGGGQQMPIFSALGAECTVLDYSEKQLQSEKEVAKRERYEINLVKADMTKPLPFEDEAFDLIFHPVSNCYIEDVVHVWKECYRILKKGGILLAGLDNGINFIFDDEEEKLMNKFLEEESFSPRTKNIKAFKTRLKNIVKDGKKISSLYYFADWLLDQESVSNEAPF